MRELGNYRSEQAVNTAHAFNICWILNVGLEIVCEVFIYTVT